MLAVLLSAGAVHADDLTLNVPVMRGGKPLVGVPITIRVFDPKSGAMKAPLRLRTDEQGHIVVHVSVASATERESAPPAARPVPPDYLIIDAPDAPLLVAELDALRPKAYRGLTQIDITTGSLLRGKVFNHKVGAPDAQVALVAVNGVPLNSAKRGVSTPQLIGKTRADGTYSLRPLQLEGNTFAQENTRFTAAATATLVVNGQQLRAGSNEFELEDAQTPANTKEQARFALSPDVDGARQGGKFARQ